MERVAEAEEAFPDGELERSVGIGTQFINAGSSTATADPYAEHAVGLVSQGNYDEEAKQNLKMESKASSQPRFRCKVPVVGAAESTSTQTLQDPNVSSLEGLPNTIPDSPRTVPHKTIGSSSSTFVSTCQELVTGAADSTYAPALQEPDAPSLDEFVDSSSGQKLVEGVVLSLEKLLDTKSYEESNTANPWTVTQNTIAVSSRTSRSRSEKFVAGFADSTTSVVTLQEPDVSSSDEYLDSSSEESVTASPWTLPRNSTVGSPPTLGPNILVYRPANSFEVFLLG